MTRFDDKPATETKQIVSANILEAEAGTNCPQGGDAGHGGRTYLRLTDEAGTAWEIRITDSDGKKTLIDSPATVELILGGDTEHATLVEALEFMVSKLKPGDRKTAAR